MAWDLKIWPCYHAVMEGPDQAARTQSFNDLLARFSDPSKRCLQVGVPNCMERKFGDNFIAIDLFDERPCIDVREDLAHTSFPDQFFDLIMCNAILEHVQDPFGCAREMARIARPGCEAWIEVPFVQPYHPHKDYDLSWGYVCAERGGGGDKEHGGDYWRFTPQGIMQLMRGFEVIRIFLVNEGGVCFWGRRV